MAEISQIRRYYEILGVAPDCSLDELKAAYRDLLVVWHPDRFQQVARLRFRGEEHTKQVNAAFQFLETRHGQYTETMLMDDDSASREQLRVANESMQEARRELEETRCQVEEIQRQASSNRRHFQNALKRAYSQRKAAEILAEKLQHQLIESRRLGEFWAGRASEDQKLREALKVAPGKWRRRLKWWLGSILGLIGFVRFSCGDWYPAEPSRLRHRFLAHDSPVS